MKNFKPNEEQHEALQRDMNEFREKFIQSLEAKAKRKLRIIEYVSALLDEEDIPFWLTTVSPSPNGRGGENYNALQFNNLAKICFENEAAGSYICALVASAYYGTVSNSPGAFPDDPPGERFWKLLTLSLEKVNPSSDSYDRANGERKEAQEYLDKIYKDNE